MLNTSAVRLRAHPIGVVHVKFMATGEPTYIPEFPKVSGTHIWLRGFA